MTLTEAKHYWFIYTVMSYMNKPYKWGGDDPMASFDCSGMVVSGLQACGIMKPKTDMTANMMLVKWGHYIVDKPSEGCLAFWLKNGKAYHVAVCLDEWFCLTADGGGSRIKTLQDAIDANAYITIRPLSHRKTSPLYVNLFQETE